MDHVKFFKGLLFIFEDGISTQNLKNYTHCTSYAFNVWGDPTFFKRNKNKHVSKLEIGQTY